MAQVFTPQPNAMKMWRVGMCVGASQFKRTGSPPIYTPAKTRGCGSGIDTLNRVCCTTDYAPYVSSLCTSMRVGPRRRWRRRYHHTRHGPADCRRPIRLSARTSAGWAATAAARMGRAHRVRPRLDRRQRCVQHMRAWARRPILSPRDLGLPGTAGYASWVQRERRPARLQCFP